MAVVLVAAGAPLSEREGGSGTSRGPSWALGLEKSRLQKRGPDRGPGQPIRTP